MAQPAAKPAAERRLTLTELLDWLVADGVAAREPAEELKKERRYWRGSQHPLTLVAQAGWKELRAPHRPLTLETLAEWLAKRVGLEYLHIDPLKINFAVVTEVMSSAYATRFRILPVELTAKEAVIATAEPFVREWEPEIARMAHREIRRVIANPVAIERCQVEFYSLARSIKGAHRAGGGSSGLSNLEQLVELGSANKNLDANDARCL
jgi:general secretion pathway protein E